MKKNEFWFCVVNVVFVASKSVPARDAVGATPLPTVVAAPGAAKDVLPSMPMILNALVTEPPVKEANGLAVVLTNFAPSAMLKVDESVVTKVAPPDAVIYGPAKVNEVGP
jgi:hypothetical protein